MRVNFREIWHNYRSEVVFFIILSSIVVLSMCLSQFIPQSVFDNTITPILITATVVTAFLGAYILFRRSDGIKARKLFGWALLVWGLSDLVYLIGWAAAPKQLMDMGATELTDYELLLGNILGWVMLMYPTEVLRPGWLTWKIAMWQLLPMFALVGLDYLIPINLSPIIALYPYVLLALLFTHIRAYRIWCKENYSTLDDIDVRWLIRYCCMLILVGVNYVYICYSDAPTRGFTQQWFVVFMMAYSIEQILYRKDPWQRLRSTAMEEVTEEPNPANAAYRATLEAWLESEKPYCNPDFQLTDLRQVLPLNRTYLSQFINTTYGCSFYKWVNGLRIKEAKRLKMEHPEWTAQDIAEHGCGFSSRQAFYRTFLRETGQTPSEWWTEQNSPTE